MSDFNLYNHLGFHNPYFIEDNGRLRISDDLTNILPDGEPHVLDFTAVVQILSAGYAFGDRTLIKGMKKTPWMAKPNESNTSWEYFEVPKHQEKDISIGDIVDNFYRLLKEELKSYIRKHQNIGILLTGGMDSRVVAAILNNLLNEEQFKKKNITAYTWGLKDSRDVVYAKEIARIFDWDWKHVVVDADQMRVNIEIAITNGCEYTPIHLHAMSKVADEKNLDCIIAGSFGDSIGRGEYSSIRVKNLASLKHKIRNPFGLLREDFYSIVSNDVEEDLNQYYTLFPQEKVYQQFEEDMQRHYMRRMLNACMSTIDKKLPLYQMFSSPEVFGFIWSIRPDNRTDYVYKDLLAKHAPQMLEIPWARTGLPYMAEDGTPDKFKKQHHDYGAMIRDHFLDHIENNIRENIDIVEKLFNKKAVMQLVKNCKKYPIKGSFMHEERLLWISTLISFIRRYNIVIDLDKLDNSGFLSSLKEDLIYKMRHFIKR